MNRYQLEVAEMDRRRRIKVRALSAIGAAVLIVMALWSANLPPTQWWTFVLNMSAASKRTSDVQAQGSAPLVPADHAAPAALARASEPPMSSGTDSSVSAAAQPLFLVETSPGRMSSEGSALIGANPDNPQTYVGGALLVNGARLAEIHRDHVVLTRNGVSAKLELYRRNAVQNSPTSALLLVGGGETEAQRPEVALRVALTDYVRPSPVYDGETLRGYQVYPGARPGVFSQLGLESGDVIAAINDQPLLEPQQSLAMFDQLMAGVAVTATIERKGAVRRITLDGSLIAADLDADRRRSAEPMPMAGLPPI